LAFVTIWLWWTGVTEEAVRETSEGEDEFEFEDDLSGRAG